MPDDTAPVPTSTTRPVETGRRTIATLPARLRELGRIRLGHQVPTDKGGTRPAALETFRLTSPSRPLIDAAAGAYGGTVEPWQPPEGPAQWQVVVDTDTLDVLVPPTHALDQAYELWRAGGCHRRCDGLVEDLAGTPCLCPQDPEQRIDLAGRGEACQPVTRLNVLLPDLPDLGVWRVEAHGFYAAVELAGAGMILDLAADRGQLLAARLRIDRRQIKRPGQPRRDFVVPVLELPTTLGQVLAAAGADQLIAGPVPAAALARPAPAALEDRPTDDAGSISSDDEHGQLVARIASTLDDAAVPGTHTAALLRARYNVDRLGALDLEQLRKLAGRLLTEAGVTAFRQAAARDFAAASLPACVECGAEPAERPDDHGRCIACSVPF